jgi:hypothetical protein
LLGTVAASAQAHQCKPSNVAGRYGYTSNGTIVSPAVGAFVSVGVVKLTAAGTLSGRQTTSIAGNFAEETIEGTFTVNPDCTGVANVNIFRGSTLVRTTLLNMVWDDLRREARGIFLTTGTSITLLGRKISHEDDD